MKFKEYTVEELVNNNMLEKPIDGNHGNKHPKSSDYVKIGVPFIMVSDINNGTINYNTCKFITQKQRESLDKGFSREGDVLLSHKATIGITCIVDNLYSEIVITPQLTCYRVKNGINKYYLKYYFDSPYFQNILKNWANSGSTRAYLGITAQLKLPILLPKLQIQNKIAKILSLIDKKIEINIQINNNLYKQCNAIYHDYLDKYSELIENKKIVEIANKVVTGKTPSTKNEEFWNGNIPFITIPDMHNQIFTVNTERTIKKVGAKALIPKDAISVSCIATVGLISISTEESQTNQQINSIVLNNKYDLYYLFEFLSEQESFMKNIASGSTTYNINKNTFENIKVPYIPSDKIIEFHNIVSKMFEKIKLNQLENNNLEQLRDTLLPKLMNGEINLDKIEI